MKKSILLVATAIGMLTTSCNKDLENLTQTPITISATYDAEGEKVAYTEDGANITAKWEAGDELIVCWNNHKNTLTLSSGAGTSSATFTGTITGTPSANSTLVCFVKDQNNTGAVTISDNGDYVYTDGTFLGQDGTLAGAAKCNLYYGTCFYGDGSNISCTFNVNTSMMKFNVFAPEDVAVGSTATLTYKSDYVALAKATFSVGAGRNNTIYLTIPAGQYNGTQHLEFKSGEIIASTILAKTQANFIAGQTYSRIVTFGPLNDPLTFEAKVAGATVTFTPASGKTLPLEYSNDGITWASYSSPLTLANVGDKVMFRGDNLIYGSTSGTNNSKFSCSGDCYLYGNVMSLISSSNYANITSVGEYAFTDLFSQNTTIYNHPTKKILLPATTLGGDCYFKMFKGCTHLTEVPELPATTLAFGCYQAMFDGCTGLTSVPARLPATTLAGMCYYYMFHGCTSLTSAPILPATTLASECYKSMFSGCTSLTTAPALPATTLANSCYWEMFGGCTSLTTAPALPATTLAAYCYGVMFASCTNLTSAPTLSATTLERHCYEAMFDGCTRLNYVKCLATDHSEDGCTDDWLNGVAATGTFIKATGVAWSAGASGIPSGWTVQEQ